MRSPKPTLRRTYVTLRTSSSRTEAVRFKVILRGVSYQEAQRVAVHERKQGRRARVLPATRTDKVRKHDEPVWIVAVRSNRHNVAPA